MNKRNVKGNKVVDPSLISNNEYNEASGAQKQIDVGPKLIPIPTPLTPFGVTVANAAAVPLPSKGRSVAIYNNAGVVGVVTFGDSTVTAQALGAVNAAQPTSVGIPCKPNDWTYLSAGDATHIITSAATLFVYLIEDDTSLVQQATR